MLENNKSMKKILIMGLDKSGKSSILLCLKGIKGLGSFSSLNPTKGIKRESFRIFGSEFSVWDFGGQEQFRKDYLLDFDKNVKGTNKIIFVIDIQKVERFSLALNYLLEIVKKVQEQKKKIDFSIFLHKYDPDIEMTNKKFDQSKVDAIIYDIKRKLPANFKYELSITSIYTVFQKKKIH
jgi:small GTP-binding protein